MNTRLSVENLTYCQNSNFITSKNNKNEDIDNRLSTESIFGKGKEPAFVPSHAVKTEQEGKEVIKKAANRFNTMADAIVAGLKAKSAESAN